MKNDKSSQRSSKSKGDKRTDTRTDTGREPESRGSCETNLCNKKA